MRRSEAPFNGKQFILNKSTGEIHDLDRESPLCRIDKTETDDIFACDTYAEAVLFASRDYPERMCPLYSGAPQGVVLAQSFLGCSL